MSLWKYLKERKLYFILVIFILLIVDITLFLDPNLSESIDTLIYINMLSILTTIIFIIMGYSRYKRELNQFIHNIKENSNMEDNYIDKEIKSIIEEKKEEVDSLRNELEEINDYMTNWIHEVKIPISVLQMIGKRINEVDSSREISKQINSQVSRIDKLVEQAMYSSRAGNYNSDFLINEVDLGQVVKEVIKKNKYQFIYNKIDLQVSEINKTILTDKKWITHIIELILDNAIKYSDVGGKIEVYLKENKKGCELHIKDYGMGIVPQDIDRVFDKGFTGENGRKRTKSTGMGLYISKKILNKLSHDINVISTSGEFCDVYITFYNLSDYFNVT
ncbi:sensor histidine kinase [Terrisporobacter sp.]|uniref:sensor histidine kinase n=1 Tax=Terrisporobacter sp. TaxID=1965305 RepID=UPI002A83AD76|nr:sensor histidine kinase [Terrisporobacter sp.]MCI6456463.1 sensor histidine kinase [Clostridium sp.]MCI7207521.1 sensor histidine kinase [Clostridium sp.]MDY4737488.1 sensor histidine kinase [Terrisporobacter sp.]